MVLSPCVQLQKGLDGGVVSLVKRIYTKKRVESDRIPLIFVFYFWRPITQAFSSGVREEKGVFILAATSVSLILVFAKQNRRFQATESLWFRILAFGGTNSVSLFWVSVKKACRQSECLCCIFLLCRRPTACEPSSGVRNKQKAFLAR